MLHSDQAGEMQKSDCPRCNGTRLIETWFDCTETHKVTVECTACVPVLNLKTSRTSGL